MEVYHNGEWGTVCDDGWDLNDAQVVCSELDLGYAVAALYNAFYGEGSGRIWVSNLKCVGNEWGIENCTHGEWGIQSCSHAEDAGVKCIKGNLYLATILYSFYYVCSYIRRIIYSQSYLHHIVKHLK